MTNKKAMKVLVKLQVERTAGLIRAARKRAGLTQVEVSRKAPITYRYYQAMEARGENLSLATLVKLAAVFKVPVATLITRKTA